MDDLKKVQMTEKVHYLDIRARMRKDPEEQLKELRKTCPKAVHAYLLGEGEGLVAAFKTLMAAGMDVPTFSLLNDMKSYLAGGDGA